MIRLTTMAALGAVLALPMTAGPGEARQIQRACVSADRSGSPALCGCIQSVANQTLTRSERRRAARFFADPHQAQVTRQSDRPRDSEFWQRYRQFGAYAEALCR